MPTDLPCFVDRTFSKPNAVIAVVHLAPLPGSPRSTLSFDDVLDRARKEAAICTEAGFDGLLIENHGDAPFPKAELDPHVPAMMAVAARLLREDSGLPIGINILRNDAAGALGAAVAAGASYVRVNVLTGVVATDQGLIEGDAAALMRYRRRLGGNVGVLADVEVKFGTPLYRPRRTDLVKATVQRGLADAVIVTGEATGATADVDMIEEVRAALPSGPILLGSGADADNIGRYAPLIDGVLVGSCLKVDGYVENDVDPDRVKRFVDAFRSATA